MRITREGYPVIVTLGGSGLLLIALYFIFDWYTLLIVGAVLTLIGAFAVFFFRHPHRDIPDDDYILVSPADGTVVRIHDLDDDYVGPAHRVDIFLSLFDVHINRIPADGTITRIDYQPGKYAAAFKDKASETNERNTVSIITPLGRLKVTQIAGLIARRIVCRLHEADVVPRGKVFGMIMFGSRTELTFPESFDIRVHLGQHVKAGETIIGRSTADA